jgi:hypothetical protein
VLLDMSIQPAQKTRIKDQARDWGVKDTLGQSTIDHLIDMGHKLRGNTNGSTRHRESDVLAALQAELDSARLRGCLNAFLNMDGELSSDFSCFIT